MTTSSAPHRRGRSAARRLLVVSLFAVGLLATAVAGPAAAHGRGSDATNYKSRVTSAAHEGLAWEVRNGDEYLALDNTTGQDVTILGYRGEPYLRIGPDGVFQNQQSEATYLNADRYAATSAPAGIDPQAEPEWVRIGDGPRHAWHDHRIHWMAPTLPPQVVDATAETTVSTWFVPYELDGEQLEVEGELRWVPGPSPVPWIAGALGVLVIAVLVPAVAARSRGGDAWRTALVRSAALVLAVVAAANVVHLVDDVATSVSPLPQTLVGAGQTALFLGIGLMGALRARRADDAATTALGVGCAAVFVGQGLLYLPALRSSQVATAFPPALTRAVIALSLAQVLPVAAATLLGGRRAAPEAAPPVPEHAPADVAPADG